MWKLYILLAIFITGLASFRDVSQTGDYALQTPVSIGLSDTLKRDIATGLIIGEHLALVKANCTGCHSTKLIQQHRFSREGWVGKIRWMQQYHNLWSLGESEKPILDYLEKYYSPESAANQIPARRALLKDTEWYKLNDK
jgi:hypothetical protein